jgi:CBS domain-containing protein
MNTVRELMHTDVVTVSAGMTLHELAQIFSENDISGAPVVDVDGQVVGVVSTTDVIRFAAESADLNVHSVRDSTVSLEEWLSSEESEGSPGSLHRYLTSDLDDYTVDRIMTSANFHVSPDTTAAELADFLLRGRIHRALVMEDGKLQGIVTTVDLLKTLVDS